MAGVTALALLGGADRARAQPFRLGAWEGALEGVVDFTHQDIKTGSSEPSTFQDIRTEERLTLRNSGAYFYDPRLLSISVAGTFGLSQEQFTAEGDSGSRNGTLSGYDVFASFLSERPFSLNLFANRNQSFLPQLLAGTTEILTENEGATLIARQLYVPSTLTFRRNFRKQDSRTGDVVSRQENQANIVTYQGLRGWSDSEMDVSYEFIDNTDKVSPDLSYRSNAGALNYSLDFGPDLERHWDSRFRYYTRTGVTDLTTATLDELVRLDHTESLRTEYGYFLIHSETSGGSATTNRAGAALRHQLYESLNTVLGADTIIQLFSNGQRDIYRGHIDSTYTKHLPGEGWLVANLGGGLQYEEDRFPDAQGFVPQETHTASSPVAFPIPLDNPFVETSSVVVTKVAVGVLPVGCIPPPGPPTLLVEGRDYTLRTTGNLTEIVPIPCAGATPGINPGDTIAVDYSFLAPASLTFTTTSLRAALSVDYGWIRPYFAHQELDQNLISGTDGQFLDDVRSDTVGIEFRYENRRLRASVLGEVRRYNSHSLTYDSVRSAQFAGLSVLPKLTLTLSGDQSLYDYENPTRQTRAFTGQSILTYVFSPNLLADASGSIRVLEDTAVPTQRTTLAGLRVRWWLRDLEVNPTLQFFSQQQGGAQTDEWRAVLYTIRRF